MFPANVFSKAQAGDRIVVLRVPANVFNDAGVLFYDVRFEAGQVLQILAPVHAHPVAVIDEE